MYQIFTQSGEFYYQSDSEMAAELIAQRIDGTVEPDYEDIDVLEFD